MNLVQAGAEQGIPCAQKLVFSNKKRCHLLFDEDMSDGSGGYFRS
jgi:hypothetical protein